MAKLCWLVRRIFWPNGSLWVTALVRKILYSGKIPTFCDRIPVFSLLVLAFDTLLWTYNSSGRGARINILKGLSYGNLSA
jgi:hypothetical protein